MFFFLLAEVVKIETGFYFIYISDQKFRQNVKQTQKLNDCISNVSFTPLKNVEFGILEVNEFNFCFPISKTEIF